MDQFALLLLAVPAAPCEYILEQVSRLRAVFSYVFVCHARGSVLTLGGAPQDDVSAHE